MIAEIAYTSSIESIVNYHKKKIEEGVAEIIYKHKVQDKNVSEINASFRAYSYLSEEKKPYTHISLNFHPDDRDKLTNELYNKIAKEYLGDMGYFDQPFLVVKHTDQDHPHIHIVTTNIDEKGKKIPRFQDRYRSQNISRKIEVNEGLTIVKSLKTDKEYKVNLTNKEDLKNYIKASIRYGLELKPKRRKDFYDVLKNQFQIGHYVTEKKGISFHLIEKEDGIDVQKFNGFGVKAMAGSKIDKEFSYTKINKRISDNFDTAPKRYRNLKLTEKTLKDNLHNFKQIKAEDFNKIFKENDIKIFHENDAYYVIDQKGKNLYSDRDLKGINFNKVSFKTELSSVGKEDIMKKISQEAFYNYKKEFSPYLKVSVFIEKIAIQEHYLNYLDSTDTFSKYEDFLNSSDIDNLHKIGAGYFSDRLNNIEKVIENENITENKIAVDLNIFAETNQLETDKLRKLFELIDIKDQYTQHSAVRNTHNLITKLNKKEKGENSDDIIVFSNVLFQHQRFFEYSDLSQSQKSHYEEIISEKHITQTLNTIKKTVITPGDFIKSMNERGIQLHLEKDKNNRSVVEASFLNYSYRKKIKGIKGFIEGTLSEVEQNVEMKIDNIEFITALDNEHAPSQYFLYKKGLADKKLLSKYEESENYKNSSEDAKYKEFINTKFFEFKRENNYLYESELIEDLITNSTEFEEFIATEPDIKEDELKPYLQSFIKKKTSAESLSESKRREREEFDNKINILRKTKSYNIGALCGIIFKGDFAEDLNSKYRENITGLVSPALNKLQEKSIFKYYSTVFESATKSIFYEQESYRSSPENILVLDKIKRYIPEDFKKNYENHFYTRYIFDYIDKYIAMENKPELIDYMSDRGISIKKEGDKYYLLFVGKNEKIDFSKTNLNTDSTKFEVEETPGERELSISTKQIEFNTAIENEDFERASYIYFTSDVEIKNTLAEFDEIKFNSSLKRIEINTAIYKYYYSLIGESEKNYESDFLKSLPKEKELFKIQFSNEGYNKHLYDEVLNEFIDEKYSEIYYSDVVEKEKNKLKEKVELAEIIGGNNTIFLLGLKYVNSQKLSDFHGKYVGNKKTIKNKEILKLQESPLFNYYSSVFENMSRQYVLNEEIKLDPNSIIVYEKFKDFLADDTKEDYRDIAVTNYIKFYTEKLDEYKIPKEETISYLNSKGIRIELEQDKLVLSMVGYATKIKREIFDSKLNYSVLKQNKWLGSIKLTDSDDTIKHAEIRNAIELGNYIGAAWLIKENNINLSFTETEKAIHKDNLDHALNQIKANALYSDIMYYTSALLNNKNQAQGTYKNKKIFKRKNKRPLR